MSGAPLAPATLQLLRERTPRLVALLARRSGDFAAAEDAVQEALVEALTDWPRDGVPDNPGGWLFHVALRRFADAQRSEQARARREAIVAAATPERQPADSELDDDSLLLLFLCCHESLSPPSAVALTLRAVGGLTTAEIASAFLVPEATMAQRISRAKRTIAEAGGRLERPAPLEEQKRLAAVLHVLYLLFNEGYVGSSGAALQRVDLAGEAIRLARLLRQAKREDAEVDGLLALLLLTDARRGARCTSDGELVALDQQERRRWDRAQIAEGSALVEAAFRRGPVGSYALQAAIAALHDEAASFAATDWRQIAALYEQLSRLSDNPMVALNRAVAVAMVEGPAAGLALLERLAVDPRLSGHHRLAAARAHLHERAGDRVAARRDYLAAAAGAANLAEKRYLLTKAAQLGEE